MRVIIDTDDVAQMQAIGQCVLVNGLKRALEDHGERAGATMRFGEPQPAFTTAQTQDGGRQRGEPTIAQKLIDDYENGRGRGVPLED